MERHIHRGVTLVELLVVIAILAILTTLGIPAMEHFLQKNRLRAAAEHLLTTLHYARAETLARPDAARNIHVSFHREDADPADWCFGLSHAAPCDCRLDDAHEAGACVLDMAGEPVLKVVSGSAYPGVRLRNIAFGAGDHTLFHPTRGTARSGHVSFALRHELRVVLGPLGRARLCSPQDDYLPGYPPC
jgi:prepilin-type N-terminal cleavage/methylation domain-containing protein